MKSLLSGASAVGSEPNTKSFNWCWLWNIVAEMFTYGWFDVNA